MTAFSRSLALLLPMEETGIPCGNLFSALSLRHALLAARLGLAGGATATITARAVGLDEEATDNGLMGYNGVLVGCAFSQFLAVSPPVALAATVAGAAATAPLAAVLKPLCGRVPQWTLAFNAATLSARP